MHNVVTAISLLKATGKYVSRFTEGQTNREAYLEGIETCVDAFEGAREHGYDRLKYLMKVGNDFAHTKRFKHSLLSNPKKYYLLAFKHATEIVASIEMRFR